MSNSTSQNVKLDQNDNAIAAHLKNAQFSFGTLQGHMVDGGQMWYGSGNTPLNWNITDNPDAQVETALKVHIRNGADLTPTGHGPNGEQDYTAPAGLQPGNDMRAAWNIDYAVTTDDNPDASAPLNSKTLGTEAFKMQITASGGAFASPTTATFDLNPATHTWVDEANPALSYGGDDFNQPGASVSLMDHVAENSVNLGFGAIQQALGHTLPELTQVGTNYDFKLSAFNGSQMVSFTHDNITLT